MHHDPARLDGQCDPRREAPRDPALASRARLGRHRLSLADRPRRQHGADLPVDFEHATQIKGGRGEPAPAVGWIKAVEARNGALWGRVDWNTDGANAVASRAYRYPSPVFRFDPATKAVLAMVSAGLTNNPNLHLAALNAPASGLFLPVLPRAFSLEPPHVLRHRRRHHRALRPERPGRGRS
ncbi:phage protease [Cereibacter changlensis]|uniref:phage protease n=1 Tax=Cereibacter changlensis TaxID=402884 RepID=UPI0040344E5F